MMTMILIAAGAFTLTMFLMRRTSAATRRDRPDGIRWRGIDWSRQEPKEEERADEPKE